MSWIHPGIEHYLFIDGNYLIKLAENMGKKWFGLPAELDFKRIEGSSKPKRTFYYDCLPVKKARQPNAEFESLKREKEQFFGRLRQLDGWHVSPGVAHWRQGTGTRQKEVDVQLAVDLLTHVHRKNMKAVTLIAGDLDFRPLIEAVVREGMYVKLIHDVNANEALVNAADESFAVGPFELIELCTDLFCRNVRIPVRSVQTGTPNGVFFEDAFRNGALVGRVQLPTPPADPNHKLSIQFEPGDPRYMVYRGMDVEQLKDYAALYHGPIEWRSST